MLSKLSIREVKEMSMTKEKPIEKWSDEEIETQVNEFWKLAFATDGKGLTPEIKDLDKKLKAEYWRREELGLHVEIDCMICTKDTVSYYEIMKEFCSDRAKIKKNICNKHIDSFNKKIKEFAK